MTRLTVTPAGLHTTEPKNVVPPFVDVVCDCRALPGQSESDIHEHVERALGGKLSYESELLEPMVGGTESSIETPLYALIEDYLAERLPGAEPLPVVTPGFTDSHFVRDVHSTVAYDFAPVFSMDAVTYYDGMHRADEALDIADLVEMTEFHLLAAQRLGQK
ncbi:MAG: hypothetical protein EXQ70_10920 [Solirubrobacterales bacterium]|nr:hypothetical protein [Solirubrobacterales bacterium]